MDYDRDQIFIDIKSAHSLQPLSDLVDNAFNRPEITICQYRVGSYISTWREAKKGDPVIYAIDDLGVAGGEITYLLKRTFRPRWIPDNNKFKTIIHFAHGLDPKQFNQQWIEYMIQCHLEAIDTRRWLFFVLAQIKPTYRLKANESLLLDKVKEMDDAENMLYKEMARSSMGDYMEGEGYCG